MFVLLVAVIDKSNFQVVGHILERSLRITYTTNTNEERMNSGYDKVERRTGLQTTEDYHQHQYHQFLLLVAQQTAEVIFF